MTKQTELAWIQEGFKHLGLTEIKGSQHNVEIIKWLKDLGAWWKNDEEAWCGTFVAWCLKQAGVKYPKHWYRALDYLNYGTKISKPAYGAVGIKTRKGGGHVCFIVGQDLKTGKLVCLGGNQNDQVCLALYNKSDFFAFYWYGKTSNPLPSRYNLPQYSGINTQKVKEN